jgi:hypothetical protein
MNHNVNNVHRDPGFGESCCCSTIATTNPLIPAVPKVDHNSCSYYEANNNKKVINTSVGKRIVGRRDI